MLEEEVDVWNLAIEEQRHPTPIDPGVTGELGLPKNGQDNSQQKDADEEASRLSAQSHGPPD